LTALVEATGLVIWTAKLRTDHAAIFQASVSRIFKAAALTEAVMAADSAVIASAEGVTVDLVAIASVAAVDLAAVALADLVVAAAAVFAAADGDEN
jgi:hypothetical protein